MQYFRSKSDAVDLNVTSWLSRHSLRLLRVSLGLVFFWFGVLKYFPNLSPAQDLAARTIDVLTFGLIPQGPSLVLVATLECAIGLGLVSGRFVRLTLLLMAFQMAGALSPLILFPEEIYGYAPYALTLEGQYIIKNFVLLAAGLAVGATVRGRRIVADPEK